jgi:F0F1-type ATP synthase epsilon subunit
MELKEALELIEQNKEKPEVKDFFTKHDPLANITKDNAGELVEKHEALKAYRDQFVSKGIETWKQNNLQKILDEEIKKANPSETDEQKRIRELEKRLDEEARARKRESLKNKALQRVSEKKLPADVLDYLVTDDEESTEKALSTYEKAMENYQKIVTEQVMKNGGREPAPSKEEPPTMTKEQARELAKTNPDKFNKLFEEGKIKL